MQASLTQRPAWSEINLEALAHNVRTIRSMLAPDVKFYAVCKNDAYGCGARETAKTMLQAGANAFAVSDPADALRIRDAGVHAPILLYAASTPDMARDIAELNLIVTIHDFDSLSAYAATGLRIQVHVELDCGYGRLGFTPDEWPRMFECLRKASTLSVVGIYTHLAQVEDPILVAQQATLFSRASALATHTGFSNIERMAASSRVLSGYPELNLNAVNPGRWLYGMVEAPWLIDTPFKPVIVGIKSRVLQVKTIPAEFPVSDPVHLARPGKLKTAVIAFGFKDGLPRQPLGGTVLVRGQRARIIGLRSTEHTVIDVSDIAEVCAGDEVVIIGRQGTASIDALEAVATYNMTMIELLPRMTLSTVRHYTNPPL